MYYVLRPSPYLFVNNVYLFSTFCKSLSLCQRFTWISDTDGRVLKSYKYVWQVYKPYRSLLYFTTAESSMCIFNISFLRLFSFFVLFSS